MAPEIRPLCEVCSANLRKEGHTLTNFTRKHQFAKIDSGFLSWEFSIDDEKGQPLAKIDRDFSGFVREIFTDTGQYVVRMDALEQRVRSLDIYERAVLLACAVSIDFDYFSRHSSGRYD